MKLTFLSNSESSKWLFCEAADFRALWNYYTTIEKDPNADDLITLGRMSLDLAGPEELYRVLSDMLPGMLHNILPKLSPRERTQVEEFYSTLSDDPGYQQQMMSFGWGKHLDGPYTFNHEAPLVKFLEAYMTMVEEGKRFMSTDLVNKVVQKNQDLFAKDPDFAKKFTKWVEVKVLEAQMKPTFGQAIKDAIRKALEEGPMDD